MENCRPKSALPAPEAGDTGEGQLEGQQGLCLVRLCWPVSLSASRSNSYRKDILKLQSLHITCPVWIKCLSWGKNIVKVPSL